MAICQNVSPKHRKLCIGDLKDIIQVLPQSIVPPISGSVDYTKKFGEVGQVFASISTPRGNQIFDGTNPDQGDITHIFGVRYDASYTTQDVVFFDLKFFEIVDVNDLEERHEWMLLSCLERGTVTNKVNR